MSTTILATKLYIPSPRPKVVLRERLIALLNEGLHSKLTLISAPAGFGKTTLVSQWIRDCKLPVAWLSLDEGDNDPIRFMTYLVAALQTVITNIGAGVLGALQSPQPPPTETTLTALLNEVSSAPANFVLVLDDYHAIDAKPIDNALAFLVENMPPHMHLIITTREDPQLPLARLRAGGQLTELRVTDLRFTPTETAGFLNRVMGLNLSAENIDALETRTEGWIAGLQLAALSMQGHKDVTSFIRAFTGTHHFVLDYLLEEVLYQQSESLQTFLLRTSILDRLCGPLCDAVLLNRSASGQETLEYIEHANLFLVPLDDERRWYRYHPLFADLLRQRLPQSNAEGAVGHVTELHSRASVWYEDNGLELEAFRHAAAANDVERAERLIEGEKMPLYFRGAVTPVLNWLESLPTAVMDARPSLWVMYASVLTFSGQQGDLVEQKLQAAEAVLSGIEPDDKTKNLIGHIAAIRAMLAVPRHQVEAMIAQSRRALEYLRPDNLAVRTGALWTMGYAYQIQGNRPAASQAYTEAISISQASGNSMVTLAATTCLGQVQESENQLYQGAESYRRVLQLFGDPPPTSTCEAYLGLARIFYEWNDLDAAERHAQQSLQLARQMENSDTPAACGVLLTRLKLAQSDVNSANTVLAQTEQFVSQHKFIHWVPAVAAAQVLTLLHQCNLTAAAHLAQAHKFPISQARVHLAQGDPCAALAVLEPFREQMETKGWADEQLKVMVLQALAHDASGERDIALQVIGDALSLAKSGGFIRIFVDEKLPMARLISEADARGMMPDYTGKLLAAFQSERQRSAGESPHPVLASSQPLTEPLSERELEILQLIADGLSNREICARLFLALDTIKGHNGRIYAKLAVQRRTEAVARARELGLL